MKKILFNNYKSFFEDFPIPEPEENDVIVKTYYSFISTGTESANFIKPKFGEIINSSKKTQTIKNYLDLAKKGIKNPKKGLNYIIHSTKDYVDLLKRKKTSDNVDFNHINANSENDEYRFGFSLGYSCSGKIIKVGKNINEFKPGDLVACGGAGQASHSEYIKVKKNLCVKIPEDCPIEYASTATLGSICMQAIRRTKVQIGENVGIIGIGLLGLITKEILKNTGVNIFGFDPDHERVNKLKQTFKGFLTSKTSDLINMVNLQTNNKGLDAIIVAAANKKEPILDEIFNLCRRKAKVVILGDILFNFQRQNFYTKELDLLISTSYGPGRYDKSYEQKGLDYPYEYVRWTLNRNLQSYLKLIKDKKINFENIIENKINFENLESFYNQHHFSKFKGVLVKYNYENKNEKTFVTKKFSNKKSGSGKFLHCGLGAYSQSTLIPLFESKNYSPEGIISSNQLSSKDFLNKKKINKVYSNVSDAVSDIDYDFVSIANRHNLHSEFLVKCIKNKIPVFLEKPVGIKWEDIIEIENIISKSDEIPFVHVNFNRRYSDIGKKLKDIIDENRMPLKIDYNISVKQLEKDHWQLDPNIGGGRNLGEAIHMYDFCNFLTNDSEIISADVVSLDNRENYPSFSEENFSAIMKYNDGSVVNINYFNCKSSQIPKEKVEISYNNQTLILNDFIELVLSNNDGERVLFKNESINKGHENSVDYFLKNINSNDNTNFFKTINTTKVALYINDKINNDNKL